MIAGVDGCPAGWIRVEMDPSGGQVYAKLFANANELFQDIHRFQVVAIDIPIGLPSNGSRGCDNAARAILKRRKSSVFPAPARKTIQATSYEEASRINEEATGSKISKQVFFLLDKIKEVDDFLQKANKNIRDRVAEVHPEVTFAIWNGVEMQYPKRRGFGFLERYSLVKKIFGNRALHIRRDFDEQGIDYSKVADDDILDSFAALWTAGRIFTNQSSSITDKPQERDETGILMRIRA